MVGDECGDCCWVGVQVQLQEQVGYVGFGGDY